MALLACLFAALSWAADAPPPADKQTVALVEFFLQAETSALPPEKVPVFMAVEPSSLPKDLRIPFRAKRAELSALKRLWDGKARPPLRRLGKESQAACHNDEVDEEDAAKYFKMMRRTGFVEISEDELEHLMQRTKCNECELQEEFTLMTIIVKARKKRRKDKPVPKLKYLLNESDPLQALLALYRQGKERSTGTDFFSLGMTPACR